MFTLSISHMVPSVTSLQICTWYPRVSVPFGMLSPVLFSEYRQRCPGIYVEIFPGHLPLVYYLGLGNRDIVFLLLCRGREDGAFQLFFSSCPLIILPYRRGRRSGQVRPDDKVDGKWRAFPHNASIRMRPCCKGVRFAPSRFATSKR